MGDGWRGLQEINNLLAVAVGAASLSIQRLVQRLLPPRISPQRLILVPHAVDVPASAECATDHGCGHQQPNPRRHDHPSVTRRASALRSDATAR